MSFTATDSSTLGPSIIPSVWNTVSENPTAYPLTSVLFIWSLPEACSHHPT
jgi:hypothetical protein